jgi:preprotein translocase subunit SecY
MFNNLGQFGGTSLILWCCHRHNAANKSYLLNKHYDGLMKSGKNRKAVA